MARGLLDEVLAGLYYAPMKKFHVKLTGSGSSFTVNEGESVLEAALRQSVMLPYSCKNGTCGSCKGRLVEG